MSLSKAQLDFLEQAATAAVMAERATGCPAELSVAQAILESCWGTAAPGHNVFGIKATDSNATYQVTKEYLDGTWVTETDRFESYHTLADCFIAHGFLLTDGKPYRDAWQQYREDPQHDLDTLIGGISRRYATDPEYAQEIMKLSKGPHVTAAIAVARAIHP